MRTATPASSMHSSPSSPQLQAKAGGGGRSSFKARARAA
jgi:hypothetical protein